MVSSKELAKVANVSIATISRVFSNSDLVNPQTREKVLKIAKEINYVPNYSARGLKNNKSNLIGVVVSDINNSFYFHILQRIFNDIDYNSYVLFSSEKPSIELKSIKSLIQSNVEGLILTPTTYNPELQDFITANNIPTLQIFRKAYDNFDSLIVDDRYGSYLATKELLENGHRNIVLIDYDLDIPTGRIDGYIDAFKEFNVDYNPNNIVKLNITEFNNEDLYKILEKLSFTAIIPTSYIFGQATLLYLKARNLRIYDDVSMIIYDDVNYASFMDISTIAHPLDEIAHAAKNILLNKLIKNTETVTHSVIKPLLIHRNSVKNILES